MPNFTIAEQIILAFEYHRLKVIRTCKYKILEEFSQQFPNTWNWSKINMKTIHDKQMRNGIVHNCYSEKSLTAI